MNYSKFDSAWSILPAAQCLFDKTKVSLKDVVTQWPDGTAVICRKPNGQLHIIAGSSGSYAKIGSSHRCYHDQTMSFFPGMWEVVNEVRYATVDGVTTFTPLVPFDDKFNADTRAAMAVFK